MKTVLVVDDEWVIADALESVLTDAGYRVLIAPNGRQGLARLTEMRPDVILLDFMMPMMNGADMMAALAADPAHKDIPVIMMSSLPESTVAEEVNGYALFLNKPFLATDVLQAVSTVLESAAGEGA